MMRVSVLLFLSILLCGCNPLAPVKTPEMHHYALNQLATLTLKSHASHHTILINKPGASPGFASTNMMYLTKPHALSSFSQNDWIAPPALQLQNAIAQSIKHSGLFKAVIIAPDASKTDYILDGHLIALVQNFTKNPSQIELAYQAYLVNAKNNRVLASKTFSFHIKTQGNNPYAGVIAANQASLRLQRSIVKFLNGVKS